MWGLSPFRALALCSGAWRESTLCNYSKMGFFVGKRVSRREKEMQDEDRYEGMRKEKRGPGTQHLVYIGMEWHLRNVWSTRTLAMFAVPVQANTPRRRVLEKLTFLF